MTSATDVVWLLPAPNMTSSFPKVQARWSPSRRQEEDIKVISQAASRLMSMSSYPNAKPSLERELDTHAHLHGRARSVRDADDQSSLEKLTVYSTGHQHRAHKPHLHCLWQGCARCRCPAAAGTVHDWARMHQNLRTAQPLSSCFPHLQPLPPCMHPFGTPSCTCMQTVSSPPILGLS